MHHSSNSMIHHSPKIINPHTRPNQTKKSNVTIISFPFTLSKMHRSPGIYASLSNPNQKPTNLTRKENKEKSGKIANVKVLDKVKSLIVPFIKCARTLQAQIPKTPANPDKRSGPHACKLLRFSRNTTCLLLLSFFLSFSHVLNTSCLCNICAVSPPPQPNQISAPK